MYEMEEMKEYSCRLFFIMCEVIIIIKSTLWELTDIYCNPK